ncbi:MAG: YHYH protein [Chloroflexi bacterium]|nr:YHYH protein [Chloroflexota bacterium]
MLAVADAIIGDPSYPIGTDKWGSSARNGWLYSCEEEFNGVGAVGGASDWRVGDFWYPARKWTVQGEIDWPSAQVSFEIVNGRRVISGNGLPVGHPTGTYPISSSDPAYQIDINPHSIGEQVVEFSLPLNPTLAATPSCTSAGTIAVALTGVAVFNALDAVGRDAPAYDILDLCAGHPEDFSRYHYHTAGTCQTEAHTLAHTLTGYALDGFGLFGLYDSQGQELTNDDLDECHGHTHDIDWDGAEINMYHYHLTNAYPYTIGCYRGSEVVVQTQSGPPGGGGQMPPPR